MTEEHPEPTRISPGTNNTATVFLSSVFSPDEKYLLAGTNTGHIVVWDIESIMVPHSQHKPLCKWKANKAYIYALSFCGSSLLSGGDDCINIWNWDSLVISEFQLPITPTASLSPPLPQNGNFGFGVGAFNYPPEINALSVDVKNNIVYAAVGDSKAYAWELNSGTCVGVFEGHTEYLHTIKVDPANSRLYTGSEDATVRIWDLRTKKTEFVLDSWKANAISGEAGPGEKSKEWISALDVNSNSNWLACGGSTGAHIWYLSYLKYCTYIPTPFAVQALMFQDDGVVVAGNSPNISQWTLDGQLRSQGRIGPSTVYSLSSLAKYPSVIVAAGTQVTVSYSISQSPIFLSIDSLDDK
eukprot:TRINITY_DN14376_c0_g1_i1.p1 TRINITY_DN14376_c0_g1~~TRINITY_DN14376_c0_g1_i1.p1  ORF type:complete len:355 (+),score=65.51 TRINITY_DN14376_c0_g1_i1:78-1142(+)